MNPSSQRNTASADDVVSLVSAVLANPETRRIMEEIAASDGVGYLKWRNFEGDEALVFSKFCERWHEQHNFGWPGGMQVASMLNLYFPISVEILRGRFSGIDDDRLEGYIYDHTKSLRKT